MSNKISSPYKFTKGEKKIIKDNFTSHNDWDTNGVFDPIKTNIKADLRPKQTNKCCYCKKELGYDIKEVEIEHIVPKSKYEAFTFEPLNLALSCPACNTKKSHTDTLVRPFTRYTKISKNYLIVHAHLDNFDEHIIIHNDCLFEGISKKGCRTIEMCELFRLKTVEKKAKKVLSMRTKQSELISLAMKATPAELAELMAEISKRIK
jgi:uncharacterized protein (TIGR02646 family)